MGKLKLGPIEDDKPVKLTIELSARVHRTLQAYAKEHAAQTGIVAPLTPERLIGPMLECFMGGDRGFTKSCR